MPGFQAASTSIREVPIWIHLPGIPIEFFQRNMLEKIGNGVGKIVKIDSHSIEGGRRRFAAISILMQEGKAMPRKVRLGGVSQEMAYVEGPW